MHCILSFSHSCLKLVNYSRFALLRYEVYFFQMRESASLNNCELEVTMFELLLRESELPPLDSSHSVENGGLMNSSSISCLTSNFIFLSSLRRAKIVSDSDFLKEIPSGWTALGVCLISNLSSLCSTVEPEV